MFQFLLFLVVVIVVGVAAYAGGFWLISQNFALHIVNASGVVDQKALVELVKLIPPLAAVLVTIVTAGTSILVAGLNWRNNKELEELKSRYVTELTELKARLDRELMVKKLEIDKSLESERVRLALVKADADRRLGLREHAQIAVSQYVRALHSLDGGMFVIDTIEELEPELVRIRHDLHEGSVHDLLAQLMAEGTYLKERAKKLETSVELRDLWREPHPDTNEALGLRFAKLSRKLFAAVQEERRHISSELTS